MLCDMYMYNNNQHNDELYNKRKVAVNCTS